MNLSILPKDLPKPRDDGACNHLTNKQIPDISRFSPVAQLIGIRPGQICKIYRYSKTAINTDFYRVCTS